VSSTSARRVRVVEEKALLWPAIRAAGRCEPHSDCAREGAHAKERVGRRVEHGVVSKRRVSDAGKVLEAIAM